MDAELERRLAGRAASQSGLITRQQLLKIGFTDHQIRSRVSGARLVVLHRSVYLVNEVRVARILREHMFSAHLST